MSQEQPIRNVQEISSTADSKETKKGIADFVHNNVVANQTDPIGVQGVKEIQSSEALGSRVEQRGEITIGEALEATALTAGHRPVDYSDAAAIQAAEVRATGRTNIVPGGVAAAAQSAATRNARLPRDEDKTKLGDILSVCHSISLLIHFKLQFH
ncbi:hypothetical protein ACS0TY_002124 [Phlomoides rotata]